MKLTIYDCDGVLVNSEEIYLAAELEFLANGKPAPDLFLHAATVESGRHACHRLYRWQPLLGRSW